MPEVEAIEALRAWARDQGLDGPGPDDPEGR
jgi:hypothetical protein